MAVLNFFCHSSSAPPAGLRKGVTIPVPRYPLSPMELPVSKSAAVPVSATALASWVLPGTGSEMCIRSPDRSAMNWWAWPVVLCLPEYSSGASAHDQHGHSDPAGGFVGQFRDELFHGVGDDAFQVGDDPGDRGLVGEHQLGDDRLGDVGAEVHENRFYCLP